MRSPMEVEVWDALFDTHSVGIANPSPAYEGHTQTHEGAGFQPAGYSWLRKESQSPIWMLAPVVLNLRGLEARAPIRSNLMWHPCGWDALSRGLESPRYESIVSHCGSHLSLYSNSLFLEYSFLCAERLRSAPLILQETNELDIWPNERNEAIESREILQGRRSSACSEVP